jgi:hypothetical protein
MSLAGDSSSGIWGRKLARTEFGRLLQRLSPAVPKALFGMRLWTSTRLALYVAYRLELDDAHRGRCCVGRRMGCNTPTPTAFIRCGRRSGVQASTSG